MTSIALIVAGGSGLRFGSQVPKQYLALKGKTILTQTIHRFLSHPEMDHVQVVIREGDEAYYTEATAELRTHPDYPKLLPFTYGGALRQDSVRHGLEALQSLHPKIVLIHDAARPFASQALISRVIAKTKEVGAAIPGLPVTDTVKHITGWQENPMIRDTLDRNTLALAQTPQGFSYPLILAAHQQHQGKPVTDDASLCEHVAIVTGEASNIKITHPADIEGYSMTQTRVGQGFDVHRFTETPVENGIVWLCGIPVSHSHGVIAHSDGDVALHALADALLGAAGLGDIGQHFPPSDMQWKDRASSYFITHIMGLLQTKGARVQNVDVTVIAERPKVGPYREKMQAKLAELLQIPLDHANIKATTTEKLGFLGREEGIAAMAVATIIIDQ